VRPHEGFWHGNPLSDKKAAPDIAARTARLLIRTITGVEGMSDQLTKLRKLTGQLQKLTYEAVKSGAMAEHPEEEQLFARAMREHMHT
jgi:hypothetical protein